ncbi:MAG: hypothetical protein IH941_09790 [Acidobacteria bacterium]|nr:hypothetical protein [Acidobacteriota bacterium]
MSIDRRWEVADRLQVVLNRLTRLASPSLPVLSVYLNLSSERIERRSVNPRLRDLLLPIKKLAASGELDHDSSMSLRDGVNRVLEMAPRFEMLLGSSVAVFLCDGLGLEEQLTMPRGVWDCAMIGPTPYLRPMRALLDQYRTVVSVVLDARTADISVSYMDEALHHKVIKAEELRKSNLAGWYALEEYRHRRHAEEVRHHLFKEIAERLSRLRRDLHIELVFVGGQTEVTAALLPFLDPKIRAMTETFVIDLHTLTPAVLATRIRELEERYERREELRMVDEVYALSDAGDLGAIGVDRVLRAANRNAIAHVLVHDGAVIEGSLCLLCGGLSPRVEECRECGEQTEDIPDLFEALIRAVIDAGGAVEHVMAPTRLAEDLVAARLRYSW